VITPFRYAQRASPQGQTIAKQRQGVLSGLQVSTKSTKANASLFAKAYDSLARFAV
jgi:hypothetical protein